MNSYRPTMRVVSLNISIAILPKLMSCYITSWVFLTWNECTSAPIHRVGSDTYSQNWCALDFMPRSHKQYTMVTKRIWRGLLFCIFATLVSQHPTTSLAYGVYLWLPDALHPWIISLHVTQSLLLMVWISICLMIILATIFIDLTERLLFLSVER